MARPKVGQYSLVRTGWFCNLCGHATYTEVITHQCNHAPHSEGEEPIAVVPKTKLKEILAILNVK